MKKAWKTILIVALCILIVGEIVLGVGLATGGSPDRIWEAAYEHYDIGSIFAFIKSFGIMGTEKLAFGWSKWAGLALMTGGVLLFKMK